MKFYTTLRMSALLGYCATLSCSCGNNCSAPGHRHNTTTHAVVHPRTSLTQDTCPPFRMMHLYQVNECPEPQLQNHQSSFYRKYEGQEIK